MTLKYKAKTGEYIFLGVFGLIIGAFGLINEIIRKPNHILESNPNTLQVFIIGFLCCFVLIFGSIYSSYIILKDNEMLRSEIFWKTHYEYQKIKKISYMDHYFLGKILVINYITKFGNLKTSRLLTLSLYKDSDVYSLLNFIHKDHPLIVLDDYCINLIKTHNSKTGTQGQV